MLNPVDKLDQWFLDRHSRFTSSEIWKLVKPARDKNKLFCEQGETYIRQKAVETLTILEEKPNLEFVKPLLWGRTYEEPAFERYIKETKNHSITYCGTLNPIFLCYNEYSGGSPDAGNIRQEKGSYSMDFLVEIKCPANSGRHLDYLQLRNQYELRDLALEYYSQIQFLLLITQAAGCHFVSYDYRYRNEKLQIKILEVKPDPGFQGNLLARLQTAQARKLDLIQSLNR